MRTALTHGTLTYLPTQPASHNHTTSASPRPAQDIFVVLHDDVENREDPVSFMQGLERQTDTLSPLVRVPFYDDTITRVKADALLYDEDSFSWFHSEGIMSVSELFPSLGVASAAISVSWRLAFGGFPPVYRTIA